MSASVPDQEQLDQSHETQHVPSDDGVIELDYDVDDEAYETASNLSYVTSIASNIRNGIQEYGRTYAVHGKHFYGLPIDEGEQQRNDLQHCKFTLLYGGKLFLAPICDFPQKILDLGTGSGIWAIDVADRYPSAQVTGVDIAVVQPEWVPPNCIFEIEDVESDWVYKKNSYDFIHGREFLLAIRDWPKLISQAYHHLKPGGWLELSATVPNTTSDDDSIPQDSAFNFLTDLFIQICDKMAVDGWAPTKWKDQLEARGFEEVKVTVYKVPSNIWPKDKTLKQIGLLESANLLHYATSGFERGWIELMRGDPAVIQVWLAKARKEIRDRSIHSYITFWNVYGRKPVRRTREAGVAS